MTRSVDSSDRRIARLELRPEIRRKVDAWRDRRVEVLASAMAGLPTDELRRLEEAAATMLRLAEQLGCSEAGDATRRAEAPRVGS